MIRFLMFDLDGTLFETAKGIHKAINGLMHERNEKPLSYELVTSFIGFGLPKLIEQLDITTQHRLGDREKMAQDFRRIYTSLFLHESHLYDGVISFLEKWPHKIAVVSNKDEFYVRKLVAHSPLKNFIWSHLIGGTTFMYKKPNPEPLYEAMRAAGATPRETLMIGDGLPDVQSAKLAGVRSIAASFGYSTVKELIGEGAHCVFHHYNELSKIIGYYG